MEPNKEPEINNSIEGREEGGAAVDNAPIEFSEPAVPKQAPDVSYNASLPADASGEVAFGAVETKANGEASAPTSKEKAKANKKSKKKKNSKKKERTINAEDVEKEQKQRMSLTDYSNHQRRNKRVRIALGTLATVLVLLLIAAIVVVVLLAMEAGNKEVQTSAQDETTALLEETDESKKTTATSEVVKLVDLFGKTKDEALSYIGHGATIESEKELDSSTLKKEVVIPLTDEKGDALSGTPTVTVRLTDKGKVAWCSYTAPTSALGYGAISFTDAIENSSVIQNSLRAAGLTDLDPAVLQAPADKAKYSTYDTDGKTLKKESTAFKGKAKAGTTTYQWSAVLTYDYNQANASGNLADTIRTVTINVSPAK